MDASPDDADFTAALAAISGVDGWLTDAQARRLWQAARRVPAGGSIVEIGSFRGRSLILLARAAAASTSIVAIDPHEGGDRGPNQIAADAERGADDHARFETNLRVAGVRERVRHVRRRSDSALGQVEGSIDLLYVDGAHRFGPAAGDIRAWGGRVCDGGTLVIHDAFNAIGVTLAVLRLLVPGNRFAYVGRSGSLAEYRRTPLRGRSRVRNGARQLAQLPYFVRMVGVKLALTARAFPLARLLGHDSHDWPY